MRGQGDRRNKSRDASAAAQDQWMFCSSAALAGWTTDGCPCRPLLAAPLLLANAWHAVHVKRPVSLPPSTLHSLRRAPTAPACCASLRVRPPFAFYLLCGF
jgi:hypothetical protein